MQRYSIELGAVDDQHPCRQFIPEDAVATGGAYCIRPPSRHFAEWLPHRRDRPPLRESGSADDSQCNPPARRASLFRAFADSIPAVVVVAAQGRDPNGARRGAPNFVAGGNAVSQLSFRHFALFLGNLALPFPEKRLREAHSPAFDP
jgi:hypothetical protein